MANTLFEQKMIAEVIEHALAQIKLYPLANVHQMDAQAGGSVDIPVLAYIGDAVDVEAGAEIPASDLTTELMNCKVKKAAKRLTFTQEEINNSFIDCNAVAEAQLSKAVNQKIEKDLFAELANATLTATIEEANVAGLGKAIVPFGENVDEPMYLFVSPADLATLRADNAFIVNASHGNAIVGSAGMIFNMEVVVTNNLEAGKMYVVKQGALGLFVKKGIDVEVQKDITKQVYDIVSTAHYVAKLVDVTKAIAVTIG